MEEGKTSAYFVADTMVTAEMKDHEPDNTTADRIPGMSGVVAVFTFIYWLLALSIVLSNSLTILVVWRSPSLRTIPNMYIIALAVADMFTGLSVPFFTLTDFPSMMVYLATRPYLCLARYLLIYTFLSNSFLCIFCIALDRFVFLVYPLRYQRIFTIRKTGFIILSTWVVSLWVGLSTLWNMNWQGKCEFYSILCRRYQLYFLVPYMGAIMLLTAALYIGITRVALRQRNAVSSLIIIERVKEDFLKRTVIRSARLFLVVYGMFVLCWSPAYVFTILGLTVGTEPLVFRVCLTLGIANSGINFIIYACMSKEFRKAFKGLVRGKCSVCNLWKGI
ncbi:adenosine receptor A3-like [Gigantopelta aegis]|uniref:adenosine receptor A3-like n=1 Tax=Gigantopelta aegis TaxID=1735272 RepID=UPI001B88CF43|nr:adenosine receptor A3-like [Gigantopelta aegis]